MKKIIVLILLLINFTAAAISEQQIGSPQQSLEQALLAEKGKVVYIDFWASWCKPCRIENPNVVEAYKKFNKQGFEVFSVSLDGMQQQPNAKQDWINAIEKDNLIWKNHVSDLQGWNSSVVPLYNISGIPFAVLLDREGKIIAKNLRGEELHNKLAELF